LIIARVDPLAAGQGKNLLPTNKLAITSPVMYKEFNQGCAAFQAAQLLPHNNQNKMNKHAATACVYGMCVVHHTPMSRSRAGITCSLFERTVMVDCA